jgi:hypothetical protein
MKKIAYIKDGVVCVIHPAPQAMHPWESEKDFLDRVIAKDVPKDATSVVVVDRLPGRGTRGAWRIIDGEVKEA